MTVDLPVRLGASLADARRITLEAAANVPQGDDLAIYVQIGDITERTAWLHIVAYARSRPTSRRSRARSAKRRLAALASAELLPAA